MSATRLTRIGFLTKLTGGSAFGMLMLVVGLMCPLFWIVVPFAPFLFLGYRARGRCPACGQYIEVTKKHGGTVCRACRARLAITNGTLRTI